MKFKFLNKEVDYSVIDHRFLTIEAELVRLREDRVNLLDTLKKHKETYKVAETFQEQIDEVKRDIEKTNRELREEKLFNEKVITEAIVEYRSDFAKSKEWIINSIKELRAKVFIQGKKK